MALGDITYDTQANHSAGNLKIVTGTLEASSTATAFAVLSTGSYIVWSSLDNIDDVDTTLRVVNNSNDGTEGTANGSLYVDTSQADVDTIRFTVAYR